MTETEIAPITAVIPTRNRAYALRRTLESLAGQSLQPAELIVIDASDKPTDDAMCSTQQINGLKSVVRWQAAEVPGAASQRNQGVRSSSQPLTAFFDDDILFEPRCVEQLYRALQSDEQLGGVNAMIVNQSYATPGSISRFVFRVMAGRRERSYAGRVLGPAVNLLPEDRDDLPEVVPVEWLNTTCTLYRRDALPDPTFPPQFTGYSMLEDLTLSLTVGRKWKLANARTARIYHDSQPGDHKADPKHISEMQLVNRHYVMTTVLRRTHFSDYLKLAMFELFSLASCLRSGTGRAVFTDSVRGRMGAVRKILTH